MKRLETIILTTTYFGIIPSLKMELLPASLNVKNVLISLLGFVRIILQNNYLL